MHHYTNWSGLEGIWNSGVLFATRYDQLNDVEEIRHFRPLLSSLLQAKIGPWLLERATGNAEVLLALAKGGGETQVATDLANIIVEVLYKTSFEKSTARPLHAVPYITSFCGHGPGQSYERENGLLSQWRAYGQEQERFSIAFDTTELQGALIEEANKFTYTFAHFSEVVYNDGSVDPSTAYKNLFAAAERFYPMLLDNILGKETSAIGLAGALIVPFLEAACTMKHRGFKEELEVRIAACPMTAEHFARMREPEKKANAGRVVKSVCSRKSGRSTNEVTFVRLFERRGGQRLPIKRVIVGPLRDQDAARKKVERLVKGEVPVVLSSTPFIG